MYLRIKTYTARYEIFTAMKIQVMVFWVVTMYSVVARFLHFRGPSCLHLQRRYPTTSLTWHQNL